MDLAEGAELFAVAVSALAESPGAIQQRLNRAYLSALANVQPGDFPVEVRPRIEDVASRMAGPVTRVIMTDDEGARLAREIVAIAFALCRLAATGG